MAAAVQKITLSPSRDTPFNKLVLSQANVRKVKAGVSIEELAEDIARRAYSTVSAYEPKMLLNKIISERYLILFHGNRTSPSKSC